MTTSNKLKLAGVALGAALMTTAAVAGSGDAKCGASKCGGEKKVEKMTDSKCGTGGEKKVVTKDTDAKCGTAKCG